MNIYFDNQSQSVDGNDYIHQKKMKTQLKMNHQAFFDTLASWLTIIQTSSFVSHFAIYDIFMMHRYKRSTSSNIKANLKLFQILGIGDRVWISTWWSKARMKMDVNPIIKKIYMSKIMEITTQNDHKYHKKLVYDNNQRINKCPWKSKS